MVVLRVVFWVTVVSSVVVTGSVVVSTVVGIVVVCAPTGNNDDRSDGRRTDRQDSENCRHRNFIAADPIP